MKLQKEFIAAILEEIKNVLLKNHASLEAVSNPLAEEVRIIAARIKKLQDPMHLRHYLLEYIGLTSAFWRAIAPYTISNQLRNSLETIVNRPQFSPEAIHTAKVSGVHEYYLEKQKELIVPLATEIRSLQTLCNSLKTTVSTLREENQRLKIENDFFMQELVKVQDQMTNRKSPVAENVLTFKKDPPAAGPSISSSACETNPAYAEGSLTPTLFPMNLSNK
jgi:hypothetical protein